MAGTTMRLVEHGAERIRGAARAQLGDLRALLDGLPRGQAGIRLNGITALHAILSPDGPIGACATTALDRIGASPPGQPPSARAVRAILFDKSPETNWSLAWHQDRTIAVKHRAAVSGFGPWTVKAGIQHVAPPFGLLARMITLRVHLDPVSADNAPLLVAPGSHRLGLVPTDAMEAAVARCGVASCLADAGDVWIYATPILHASHAAIRPTHRRVLQIDYAAEDLPAGLEWAGI